VAARGRHAFAAYCGYGVWLKPSAAAKAGSPDCLAWPRCTARAFTVLPPDPVPRGDAGFDGPTSLARIDLITERADKAWHPAQAEHRHRLARFRYKRCAQLLKFAEMSQFQWLP
jgi:hypothetical protein